MSSEDKPHLSHWHILLQITTLPSFRPNYTTALTTITIKVKAHSEHASFWIPSFLVTDFFVLASQLITQLLEKPLCDLRVVILMDINNLILFAFRFWPENKTTILYVNWNYLNWCNTSIHKLFYKVHLASFLIQYSILSDILIIEIIPSWIFFFVTNKNNNLNCLIYFCHWLLLDVCIIAHSHNSLWWGDSCFSIKNNLCSLEKVTHFVNVIPTPTLCNCNPQHLQ